MGGELSGGCRKYLLEGPVIGLTWEEKRFIEKRVVGRSNRTERKMHQRRKKRIFRIVSDPDPDWIWIQGSSGSGFWGLKKVQKC